MWRIGNGRKVSFWEDHWSKDFLLKDIQIENSNINWNLMVTEVIEEGKWKLNV